MSEVQTVVSIAALALAVIGAIIAGSMRFANVETRIAQVESAQLSATVKLDNIAVILARIEGRLIERDQRIKANNP